MCKFMIAVESIWLFVRHQTAMPIPKILRRNYHSILAHSTIFELLWRVTEVMIFGLARTTPRQLNSQLPTQPGWGPIALWSTLYVLATSFTTAALFGDTRAYTSSILDFTHGETHHSWDDNAFWEFGHLLWRPLGWVAFKISQPVTSFFVGPEPRINIAICLFALVWIAGLFSVLVLNLILRRLGAGTASANVATLAFMFCQAFLNYVQTGVPYIPGLLLLLLSIYCLVANGSDPDKLWLTTLTAGTALAGAVCLWSLYVLATPVILLTPLIFLSGNIQGRIRLGLQACVTAGLLTICAYSLTVVHLHLYSAREVLNWISTSSHGVDNIRGLGRTVFGLARSFINMGLDGVLYKRFLLHDPYNSVSFTELLRLSLGKLLLFYFFLACVVTALLRSKDYRLLMGLVAAATPVIGFALFWQGGDMERYLPFYPLVFIALSRSLDRSARSGYFRTFVIIFVAFIVVNNGFALSKFGLDQRRLQEKNRIAPLLPVLKPGSQVVVLYHELVDLTSDPLHSSVREEELPTYILLIPGTSGILTWRQDFAAAGLAVWGQGADVWISNRLLDTRPAADTFWVEGDDRRVSWHDVHDFFSQLEIGGSAGELDGFKIISPSPRNRMLLQTMVRERTVSGVNPGDRRE